MKRLTSPKQQRGIALLAALMLVVMLTLIGFRVAEQGKDNTAITGANVRHSQVFEAAEQTMRNAMTFIQHIRNGQPIATSAPYTAYNATAKPYKTKTDFANFDIDKIVDKTTKAPTVAGQLITKDPGYSFIWQEGALETLVCGTTTPCPEGINFSNYLDKNIWQQYAIKSDFAGGSNPAIDNSNYLSSIRTYTFIQTVRKGDSTGGLYGTASEADGSTSSSGYYYLITVKASGYPPIYKKSGGTTTVTIDDSDPANARENVILQSVYVQVY